MLHGGALPVPVDGPLLVMAGFSVVNIMQHPVMVPLVHRFRMRPSLAVPMWLYYAAFNLVYVLATLGVIRVRGMQPAQP